VCFAREPVTGNILYVSIFTGQVRRIRYTGPIGGDTPPVAIATASPTTGVPPLSVTFDGTQSSDADGDSLSWSWLFGDGTGSTLRNPQHTYTQAGSYLAILTVGDGRGAEGRDSVALLIAPVTPFPSTPVLDNFNRANAPLGSPWAADVAGLGVQNNAMVQTAGYGFPIWDGDVFGPDQEAYITFKTITGSAAPERDLVLKAQGTTSSVAHIEVRYDASLAQVDVGTYQPGVGWLVQGDPIPATFAAGDRFGVRTYSNGDVEVYKNSTKIGTRPLLGWPFIDNGGRIGLTIDAINRGSFDDFGGGDVVFAVNHPPVATITAPPDSSFYFAPETLTVHGTAFDQDEPVDSLKIHWDVFLHHNNHLHIALSFDGADSASFATEDHDDGSGVWYEARLIVTDTGGLSDTTSREFFPENDLEPSPLVTNADHLAPDQPASWQFWIRNHGRLLAHTSHWVMLAGSTVLAEGDTLVAALDSVAIHRVLPPSLGAGTYTLRVVVDTLGVVVETDETNNAWVGTLVIGGEATAVGSGLPATIALSNPFPNPSHAAVAFSLALPRAGNVSFDVIDLQGRSVWSEESRRLEAGRWSLGWNGNTRAGSPAASGVYLARVRVDGRTFIKRMALLR
jgi:hypothetical protein